MRRSQVVTGLARGHTPAPPQGGALAIQPNNFDLLRLFAALQVVVLHAWEHLELPTGGFAGSLRTLLSFFPGVPIFFVISGFLISRSWERSHDLKSYARNRFIRIYPALWAAFAVSLILLATLGALSLSNLGQASFWAWLVAQVSFGQFYNPTFLRDFGVGVVNGSLWTIPVELAFYAFLPVFYTFGVDRASPRASRIVTGMLFVGSFAAFLVTTEGSGTSRSFVAKALNVTLAPHLYMFMLGMGLQRNLQFVDRWLAGRAWVWLAALVSFMVSTHLAGDKPAWSFAPIVFVHRILLAMTTLSCAYSARSLAGRWLRGADVSYGAYLYHMLVVNLLVELGLGKGSSSGLVAVLAGTLALAGLSWHYVEHPALRRKTRSLRPL